MEVDLGDGTRHVRALLADWLRQSAFNRRIRHGDGQAGIVPEATRAALVETTVSPHPYELTHEHDGDFPALQLAEASQ